MSSPSNRAANEANAAEKQRQASIAGTQSRVNQVFDGPQRQADIRDFVDARRTFNMDDLNRQKTDTDRELKFALARGGLVGGSTQRDQAKTFGEEYSRGVLNVERDAQGAGANLAAADQDSRARLIQLATSGLDATTGASQAAAAMRSNLEAGKSTMQAQDMGNAFGGIKTFTDRARDAAERRRANQDAGWNLYQPTAATSFAYGGNGG